jgi:general secretion pathway protein H
MWSCQLFAPASRLAPRAARGAGFTLIELLLVLAIAGLLMAVTPPLLSSAFPGLQLKGTAREVAAGLRSARDRAIASRSQVVVTLDLQARQMRVPGRPRPVALPKDLDVKLTTAQSELADEAHGGIRFYPDGTCTGGRVTLRYRKAGYDVDLDWLTGRIRVEPLSAADL